MNKLLASFFMSVSLMGQEWTPADTKLEVAYLMLHTADWLQTLEIAESERLYERNPILGRHPSRGEVNRYFIATGILHVVLAKALPPKPRHWFQGVTISMEAGCVGMNYNLGVRVKL